MKIPKLNTTLFLSGLALPAAFFPSPLQALTLILQEGPGGGGIVRETPDGLSLRFDLSGLPPDAMLRSARLEVHPIPGASGENRTFAILAPREPSRMDQDLSRFGQEPFGYLQDAPRADSVGVLEMRPGWPGWIGSDVTAAVQAWLDDPLANHGLSLYPMEGGGDDSTHTGPSTAIPWIRSAGRDGRGPRLLVEYARPAFGAVSLSRQDIGKICMCMNGRLTIRRSDAFAPESWEISSLDGKRIRPPRADISGGAAEMDMTRFPKGLYHVALKDRAGRVLHTRIKVD